MSAKYALVLLGLISSHLTLALCAHVLRGIYTPASNNSYSLSAFQEDLANTFFSPWKKKIIYHLWKKEAEEGQQIIQLNDGVLNISGNGTIDRIPLPYFLNLPREIHDAYVAIARAEGLPPGERYVVLPAKLAASFGVKHFYSNAAVIASLTHTGQILGLLGLYYPEPIMAESDPSSLEEDEVIVFVKLESQKPIAIEDPFRSWANSAGIMIDKAISEAPSKFVKIDLSSDAHVSFSNSNDLTQHVEEMVQKEIIAKGKKVKKVIVAGHGSPGEVKSDIIGSIATEKFADVISPLSNTLTEKAEIHFSSCFLANNDAGQKSVNLAAEKLLSKGGTVYASKPAGFSMLNKENKSYFFLLPASRIAEEVFTTFLQRGLSDNRKPLSLLESATYKYEVKK